MLTRKQYDLLVFINRRLEENGISPSFEEMKEALGLRSKSGVHRLITGLEERGFIRRLPHRARALEVLKAPEESGAAAKAKQEAAANVVRPNFASKPVAAEASAVALPLFGRIAAGTPIEALSEPEHTVDIPPSMLGRGEYYEIGRAHV